jgi:signal transduction histidine kinase
MPKDAAQRAGRELYDNVNQLLTFALLQLESGDAPAAAANIRRVVEDLRRIERGETPRLPDGGLTKALQQLSMEFIATARVRLRLSNRLPSELEPGLELGVYRIVQEALTNVAKHASAKNALVELSLRRGWVRLVVEDDGQGLLAGTQPEALRGIRARVALLRGTITLDTAPGAGTRLDVRLPG